MTPTNGDHSNDLFMALTNLGVVGIIATVSIVGMLRFVDHFRPAIGDIISFVPGKQVSSDTLAQLTVMPVGPSPASPCVLDVRAMREAGGSLVIDAVRSEPTVSYRVHWAGGPTSDGQTNCGAEAELRLNQSDIVALKLAADG